MLTVVAKLADFRLQFGVGLRFGSRRYLAADQTLVRLGVINLACDPQRADHVVDILALAEQIEEDARRVRRVRRPQLEPAARFRIQRADARGIAMRLRVKQAGEPELRIVGDRRAHHLHVGTLKMRLRLRENYRRRTIAGKRPAPHQVPARARDGGAVETKLVEEGVLLLRLVHQQHVGMFGEILPDAREVVNRLHANGFQMIRRADAGQHHHLRRIVRAA